MDTDGLTMVVGTHDEELRLLRELIDVQQRALALQTEMIDGLRESLDATINAIEGVQTIVVRHDRTLRMIHRGLHSTSDPEMRNP